MGKGQVFLFQKLINHYKNSLASFHVPGHKMGRGFNPIGRKYYKEILKLDMTELTGLDDLHQPKEVILESEKRAACLYQADKTFFLVNGSTTGNIAMILTICQPGDKIIVQRNVHKSVINGLILARARPIYIDPEPIPQLGISGGIRKSSLINALRMNEDVKAVLITNPSYYGISINIEAISDIVHKYNIPLLVDEAHGAHYGLHPMFPSSAIQNGADISVQSTHKTLSAMTMGSMLHVKSKYVDIDRLKMFLSMIQTSSPSYPILASLDLTCDWIESEGKRLWDQIFKYLNTFYKKAINFKNINVIHNFEHDEFLLDPLKIIIHSKNEHYTGIDIQKLLERKKIFPELADFHNTLLIASLGTSNKDFDILYKALVDIDEKIKSNHKGILNFEYINKINYLENKNTTDVSFDKILYSDTTYVLIEKAVGNIAAEMITPYPPGIPVVQLGEVITIDRVKYITSLYNMGIKIQGLYSNKQGNSIKIIKNIK